MGPTDLSYAQRKDQLPMEGDDADEEALLQALELCRDQSERFFIYHRLGRLYEHQGQAEKAKTVYGRAINEGSDVPESYGRLAALYERENQWEKAAIILEKAISNLGWFDEFHRRLNRLYRKIKRPAPDALIIRNELDAMKREAQSYLKRQRKSPIDMK